MDEGLSPIGEPTAAQRRSLLNRRRFLQLSAAATGVGLASAALVQPAEAAAGLTSAGVSSAGRTGSPRTRISGTAQQSGTLPTGEVLVPAPTGTASVDTANALQALDCPAGTTVIFQASSSAVYSIDQELPVPPGVRVTGLGANNEEYSTGLMPTLQQAIGTSLKCIMASAGYLAGLYDTPQYNNGVPQTTADSAIEVDHLAFDGQNGGSPGAGNTVGHQLVLYSVGSSVHDCYFLNAAQAGLVLADANYAGTPCVTAQVDNRIYDNKLFVSGTYGIWVTQTNGSGGATDGFMLANVVNSPSLQGRNTPPNINPLTGVGYEAIRLDMAAGWWVANNHAFACPGNGMYFGMPWGLHMADNSTDSFGCNPTADQTFVGYAFEINGDVTQTQPTLVNGNQLSAYEGFNTTAAHSPSASNTYLYFQVTMTASSWSDTTWFEQAGNSVHQDSQVPTPVGSAALTSGSKVVTIPHQPVYNVIQAGMSVTDSQGHIPAGTTVVSYTPGSTDTMVLSADATGSSSNDTVSFLAPTSQGWTYVNSLAGSTLLVNRTNEIVSGTIKATPAISGAGTVTIIDPLYSAGGLQVTGTAQANQVLVATSSTTAIWAPVQSVTPAQSLVTVLTTSGTYPVPSGVSSLRITCVGGGGGGGGGGSASGSIVQQGGGAGAAGTSATQIINVASGETLTATVGAGGTGGAGGAAGGNNAGGTGTAGGSATVTGSGINVTGAGGPGGAGAAGKSATAVDGGAYGGQPGELATATSAGCGGSSGQAGGASIDYAGGGGGGGGQSTASAGGGGGTAGSSTGPGAGGSPGAASGPSGANGQTANSNGAGGGGGGGGTAGASGGTGGGGAPGYVIIEIIG
jgi:hypothetical protein